jgi:hypothetical protein
MSEELKPCPFCGEIAEKYDLDVYSIQHKQNCWLVSTEYITNFCEQWITTTADADEWNHRPTEDKLRAEVEELKEYADNSHARGFRDGVKTERERLSDAVEENENLKRAIQEMEAEG